MPTIDQMQFTIEQWRIIYEFCEAAAGIEPYLDMWCDVQMVQTVYRSPSENMRRAADREDAKNTAISRYRAAGLALQKLFNELNISFTASFPGTGRATRIL